MFVWIPEAPGPLYADKAGGLTADAWSALHFDTKEACEAWIETNAHVNFTAQEHGFYGWKV